MKHIVTLIAITFLAALTLCAQPKIQIDGGNVIDMGDVYTGTKAEKVLKVKNIGTEVLKISDVHASCGCTATMMSESEKTLAPGQEGKISVSINTAGFQGGKFTKSVTVSSNDSSNAKLALSFNLNVITVLNMDPKFISFDNCKTDTTYTKLITVTNPAKDRIKINSVNAPASQLKDMVKVDLMKNQLGPGESTQLQVVLHSSKPGTYQDNIELVTDSKIQPKFQVQVHAWIVKK
jgi:hypothetical protein